MFYFDNELTIKAVELLYKSSELKDILLDYNKIIDVLKDNRNYSSQDMRKLDYYIKEKYPEINYFYNICVNTKWKSLDNFFDINNNYANGNDNEVEMLKFDAYFLCAFALKLSGEIADYYDYLDKKYIIKAIF